MTDPYKTVYPSPDVPPFPVIDTAPTDQPQQIGRYRIEKILGRGGFGLVFLAHDGQLQRLVAIKVPHGTPTAAECESFLNEARRLAQLRHPGLVVVISDFRDQHEWERPLGALRLRHATVAVEVADPREGELPAAGRLALVDPETGELIQVNSSSERLRERFAALERERRERVSAELRRLGIRHVRLSTDQDWLLELGHRIG